MQCQFAGTDHEVWVVKTELDAYPGYMYESAYAYRSICKTGKLVSFLLQECDQSMHFVMKMTQYMVYNLLLLTIFKMLRQ